MTPIEALKQIESWPRHTRDDSVDTVQRMQTIAKDALAAAGKVPNVADVLWAKTCALSGVLDANIQLRARIAELEKERDLAKHHWRQAQAAYDTLAKELAPARAEGIAAERERIAKWFEDKYVEESGVEWGLSDHEERVDIRDHNRRVMAYAAAIREAQP